MSFLSGFPHGWSAFISLPSWQCAGRSAQVINTLTGKALTGAETPEEVLALGSAKVRAASEARGKITNAIGQLRNLHSLINRVYLSARESARMVSLTAR